MNIFKVLTLIALGASASGVADQISTSEALSTEQDKEALFDRDDFFAVVDINNRQLSPKTARIGTFLPLNCNSDLDSVDCSTNKISTILSGGSPLTIPCGGAFWCCLLFRYYTWDIFVYAYCAFNWTSAVSVNWVTCNSFSHVSFYN